MIKGPSALAETMPVTLRDGTSAWLRPARPDDIDRLAQLFIRSSSESLALRFFTPKREVERKVLEDLVTIDGIERMTYLVVERAGDEEAIVGVGNFARHPRWDTAEVAFFVEDAFQGKGVGTLLLEHLAEHARRQGIFTLIADVLSTNQRMLDVFQHSGFRNTVTVDHDVLQISLPASADELALSQAAQRERVAASASLLPFFQPKSVAVIGASRERHGIGHVVFEQLLNAGFEGPVYPVNRAARYVASVRAYPSILDVPDDVDLAVVAVPAEGVLAVVDDCARKRVRALVVLSAGFAETGAEGKALQDTLLYKVRAQGMRLVGPNCLGLLNTAPGIRLNASFSQTFPPHGRVAMVSQSGALGIALLEYANELGLGISTFVSIGNRGDVSNNDLLQYWDQDPDTDLIVLYVESFGNPRKFARIARQVARRKPILAVKSGRTAGGSRAAQSHTAALADNERAVSALFHQAGVIRADTLEELFDAATVLANQPLPAGDRVAILTNAGGPAILCADACEGEGLQLAAFGAETQTFLRALLPAAASLANPVDMIASASAEQYGGAIRQILADPNVDALIVIYTPVGIADDAEVVSAINSTVEAARTAGDTETPVLACLMMRQEPRPGQREHETVSAPAAIPTFRFPESAARALARAVAYADWRRRPAGDVPKPAGTDATTARAVVDHVLPRAGEAWLDPEQCARLLSAAAIEVVPYTIARTPEEAATAAAALGFPVAAKIVSSRILHKTEAGGVILNLATAEAVQAACSDLLTRLGQDADGLLIQRMVAEGQEVIVGVVDDPSFGPLIGFGLGGTAAEVLQDITFRITPLTDVDAHDMVHSIRGLPLLEGYRGQEPADLDAVEQLLARISWLVEEVPEIAEMDLNPVKVLPRGHGLALPDVRIRLRR